MFLRQLQTCTGGLNIQPLKFCWVLTNKIQDMAPYLLLNVKIGDNVPIRVEPRPHRIFETFFEFQTFLINVDPPPIRSNSDFFKIQTILMVAVPRGHPSKMVYLHRKRLNFITNGQNKSRYPQADIKTSMFACKNTTIVILFFSFWMVSKGYF